ncbi:hypothetical protein HPP92_004560 [Vanilla planifolia]|uniref:Saposin B-type domain-containing protein n=1 Tax=Vanilla planifolia TaxID=51239 RepID=A0A835VGJ0_VANPL|nr:hypothetical protein HPP92_004560 [Vanilla planifolia]
MASKLRVRSAVFLLLFVSCHVSFFLASAKKKAAPSTARKEDIPYIKCQVCERLAYQIHKQVKEKESKTSPKKISEFDVIGLTENICNLKKAEADWILQIDIVEKGDKLEEIDQGVEGQCNTECKTIERACQEIMDYSDTDVAEFVFKSKPSLDLLVDFICNDLSKSCAVKAPPVPEGRVPGEPFVAKPTKDAEMDKILRSMEGMPGAPSMKMYSREDLMNNNFGDEDEDDDDNDDDDFLKNVKKAVNQKNSEQDLSLKEKVVQSIKGTGKKVKGHVNKVSKEIANWWRRRKAGSNSSKESKKEL